jgi:hypothetical protein
MKKKFFTLFCLVALNFGFLFTSNSLLGQTIHYQAIVRNDEGAPMINQSLQFKLSIHSDSISGPVIYSEAQDAISGELGWVNLDVGLGVALIGNWNEIQWNNGMLYLHVEMMVNSSWVLVGSQKLYAVPYSFYSKSADFLINDKFPVYDDNIDAIAAGLSIGSVYRTPSGVLKVVFE